MADIDLDIQIKDDYHLGHMLLDCFKRRKPEDICHINGATDEKATFKSVLNHTVKLARSLRNFGLKPGDVVALSGFNHVTLPIPFHASLMNGMPIAGVDPFFKYIEIKSFLKITEPKLIFCQYAAYETFREAAKDLNLDFTIVTFDEGDLTFDKFIKKYDDNTPIEDFKPTVFNTKKIFAWLTTTSGVTGVPKVVAISHQMGLISSKDFISMGALGSFTKNRPQKMGLMLATIQCMTASLCAVAMAFVNTIMLMTTNIGSVDHIIDLVNKYKPEFFPVTPSYIALMLNSEKFCDFTCFDNVAIGGAKVYKDLLIQLKSRVRQDTGIFEVYGCTEVMGAITKTELDTPFGSCGKLLPGREAKLIDRNGKEITEPYLPGELVYKGPMMSEYYKNPEETAKLFTEDGWLKTGDQLYRDEKGLFYYVERMKMIMKFRCVHIIPPELEELILTHPGVQEVCVTSIEHHVDQEWPVACVVRRPGQTVTADEIKDLVADKLSDTKRLRGGVVFMDKLPKTSTGKVARMQLREYVAKAQRE